MIKEERHNHILTVVTRKGKVFYDGLSRELKISEDTVRRDIEMLHNNGLLLKVRGGAISVAKNPLSFQDRSSHSAKEKNIIARKAQQFIKSGKTIFMDGGSTISAIVGQLPGNASFRLVTNNMALIPLVSKLKNVELILLGGTYDRVTEINTGGQTRKEVSKYMADVYFMGTCAVQKDFGISAVFQHDGEIKEVMLKNARKTFALADSTKLNLTEFYKVCDLKSIDSLITDIPTNDPRLDEFRNSAIQLI